MYTLVLLNGGLGVRVGASMPKQLLRLKGVPIFIYPLRIADELDEITSVVMNYPKGWKDKIQTIVKQYAIQTPISYVEPGKTRQASVHQMLELVKTKHTLLHEAARPLISKKDFSQLMAHKADNVTQTQPVPFTVLQKAQGKEQHIGGILDRASLLNIQLPQKFKTETLRNAHEQAVAAKETFTEDASAVFKYGGKVSYVTGSERNFKITAKLDVDLAEFLAGRLD
jgi:2-C-methyl-D-erythritol 4-phosphate cytidylyltransferase